MNETQSPFSSEHFTVCLLTRIYNSTVKQNPNDAPDLSKAEDRRSLVEFVENMPASDVSGTIFKAVHFPGTLDTTVEFPPELVAEVSKALASKFEDAHLREQR